MLCKVCNIEINDASSFCPYCGTPVSEQTAASDPTLEGIHNGDASVSGQAPAESETEKKKLNTKAMWGLILGAVSYLTCFGPIAGIPGIVFSVKGWKAEHKVMAILGLILSILGILSWVGLIFYIIFYAIYFGMFIMDGDVPTDIIYDLWMLQKILF